MGLLLISIKCENMAKPRKVRMQTKPKCGLCANALLNVSFCLGQLPLLSCVPLVAHGCRSSVINANQKVLVIFTEMVTGILSDAIYVKH